MNAARTAASTARSKSASANTTNGFLPPSSSDTLRNDVAACAAIAAPVFVLPVNEIAFTPRCATSGAPHVGPLPCTMFSTPGGSPASSDRRPSIHAVKGVISDGFATTALPAASAGAIFQVNRYSGRFHGEMHATTPSGWRNV